MEKTAATHAATTERLLAEGGPSPAAPPETPECLTLLSTAPVGAVSHRALRALEG